VHEFLAFGHLRAGHRLQWQNIGRNLVDGGLNFNQAETNILVLQAAWEAGPATSTTSDSYAYLRDTHTCLKEPSFGMDVLNALNEAFSCIENNWQCATSARTFAALALRVLSLSLDSEVHRQCLQFLVVVRAATLRWTRELSIMLRESETDKQRIMWTASVLESALSCHSTFDVDAEYLPELLNSRETHACLIECAITVFDICPTTNTSLPETVQQLLFRFSRLSHRLEPAVRELILRDPRGLDDSVSQLWSSYVPANPWKSMRALPDEWVTTQTVDNGNSNPATVHFNMLTGILLVDGSSLNSLPMAFESHQSYKRVFGLVSFPYENNIMSLN
jgi:hypothetical protein